MQVSPIPLDFDVSNRGDIGIKSKSLILEVLHGTLLGSAGHMMFKNAKLLMLQIDLHFKREKKGWECFCRSSFEDLYFCNACECRRFFVTKHFLNTS